MFDKRDIFLFEELSDTGDNIAVSEETSVSAENDIKGDSALEGSVDNEEGERESFVDLQQSTDGAGQNESRVDDSGEIADVLPGQESGSGVPASDGSAAGVSDGNVIYVSGDVFISPVSDTEEELIAYADSVSYIASSNFPYNAVFFECDGVPIVFPSSYADDVSVNSGELINVGASYTFGVELPSSGVSNYVVSEVTVPTYHSATWYQYLHNYGQPYRVVDRYISSSGSYSSYTRQDLSLEFSGGNDWAGFSVRWLLVLFVVVLLIIREVRTWLTS